MLRSFEYGKFSKWAFNIGHMKWTYFTSLRVIPTTTLFSDIVSDISSGSVYGIYIYIYWHSIWHLFLAYTLTLFLAYMLILSGIYSDVLPHSIWHLFRHSFSHSMFGSRCGPLHPEFAIWLRSVHAHSQCWYRGENQEEKKEKEEEKEKEELHLR